MFLMLTLVLIMHTCWYTAQITFQNHVVLGVLFLNFYNLLICGFVGAFVPLKCVHGLYLIIHSATSSCGVSALAFPIWLGLKGFVVVVLLIVLGSPNATLPLVSMALISLPCRQKS